MNTRLLFPRPGFSQTLIVGVAALLATGAPIPLDTLVVRRVNIPMTIHASKSDPPRVAFDQLTRSGQALKEAAHEQSVQTVDLNQGAAPTEKQSEQSAPQSLQRRADLQPLVVSSVEQKWIPKLVINQSSLESGVEKKTTAVTESAPVETVVSNQQGYVIKGSFGLAPEGIAFGPGKHFEITRKTESGSRESGQIDPWSSQFSIRVPELSGSLVVRLYDENGQQEGEGAFRLSELIVKRNQPIKISVTRSRNEVSVSTIAYSPADESMFSPPKPAERGLRSNMLIAGLDHRGPTQPTGETQIKRVHPASWNLIRSEGAEGFEPGIFLNKAGADSRLPLFREKMISALRSIALDQGKRSALPPTGSVVWGRVIQLGKGVSNAKVEAETHPGAQVVYFNSLLIPDEKLETTSGNGYFAILDLPAGMHGVVASIQGNYFSHVNVITDDNSVSPVEIENAVSYVTTNLQITEAFTKQAAVAEIEMQSLAKPVTVFGKTTLQLPELKRLSYLRVSPQSLENASFTMPYSDSDDEINVPMLKNEWINRIIQLSGVEREPGTGVIVGFLRGQDFEVYLPHVEGFAAQNIRYFDKDGEPTASATKDGGFLIVNVPVGIQSVTVYSQKEDLALSQVLPVDADSLGVLKFIF